MSAKTKVNASTYDRPITIQKPVDTDDGQGGSTRTWVDYYPCMASLESFARGRGLVRAYFAMQLYPMQSRIIAIRWQTDFPVDATMRIVSVQGGKTHIFQIIDPDNFTVANVEIVMLCTEWQAKGAP